MKKRRKEIKKEEGKEDLRRRKRKLRGRVKRTVVRGKSMLKKGRGAKNCKKEAEEGRRT